ncbi:MurR/RpiR family transcriptional regulator [Blautia schinkii]|nr:MurR/RpiR family transcriptional regulator [Blautia schinkii]
MVNSSLFAQIRSKYATMTSVERIIADYFLNTTPPEEINPAEITASLFVSKASLSRFAQKLGFDGFREFIYQYKIDSAERSQSDTLNSSDRKVYEDYAFILTEAPKNIDNRALEKAISLIRNSKRIMIYGDGLSGYAAGEFMIRFKRLGLPVEVYTNDFMMLTNSAIVEPGTLVIGISLSGTTKNTLLGLKNAHNNGAKTIFITSRHSKNYKFDVVLYAASLPQMNTGMFISPQFPILLIIDLLFTRLVDMDSETYITNYQDTLEALKHNQTKLPSYPNGRHQ